jgi:hypothetical protein
MKKLRLLILAALLTLSTASASAAAAANDWQASYSSLLQKYVIPAGVNYQAWHDNSEDRATLQAVVAAIADTNPAPLTSDQQLAFYLNAYNANILDRILADYPTKGPGGGNALGRAKFFRWNKITVTGKSLTFSDLENDVIRKQFSEPRIHFALNCASASCPPLLNKAFDATTLDQTLTTLTKQYLNNNPHGVQLSNDTVQLSEIFDWYQDDFANGNLIPWINQYRSAQIPDNTTISFMPYDWSLNAAK